MSIKRMNTIIAVAISIVVVITIVLFIFLNLWMNELAEVHGDVDTMTARVRMGLIAIGVIFFVSLAAFAAAVGWFSKKANWYDGILDYIPFGLSVTDMSLNTTFFNKPAADMLGTTRAKALGTKCADVWNAGICRTPNCGVECLRRGHPSTIFEQGGMYFKVDVSYLKDKNGKSVGHVETVQDVSEMLTEQKRKEELVEDVGSIIESCATALTQITDDSRNLARDSSQQSASVQQLSASISEIAQITKDNADMAERAASLADTIMHNAEKGSRQMDEMTTAVTEINQASQRINKVIKVIDDIAFQTNILALNAAVEAARAGQHGKGFAVVAEEVRNLAAKSAEAAKDTGELISNSIDKAELGARIAGETAESLTEIVEGINESNKLINDIAKYSGEQSQGISTINRGIEHVAQGIQQTNTVAEMSVSTSQKISDQTNMLDKLMKEFKGDSGDSEQRALPEG